MNNELVGEWAAPETVDLINETIVGRVGTGIFMVLATVIALVRGNYLVGVLGSISLLLFGLFLSSTRELLAVLVQVVRHEALKKEAENEAGEE